MTSARGRKSDGAIVAAFAVALLWLGTIGQLVGGDAVASWSSAALIVAYAGCLVMYPDARTTPWVGWIILAGAVVLAVVFVIGGPGLGRQAWWNIVSLLLIVAGTAVAVWRYRRRLDTAERAAVRWSLVGVLIAVQGMMGLILLAIALGGDDIWSLGAAGSVGAAVAVLVFPAAATVGLVVGSRGRGDEVLRITVAISGMLWASALVASLAAFAATWMDADPRGVAIAAAATAAAAGAATWTVAWRLSRRLVYGRRPDALRAGADTLADLAGERRIDDVLRRLAERAIIAVGSAGVSAEALGVRAVAGGEPGTAASPFVLSYRGEALGVLTVDPRRAETALTARDEAVALAIATAAGPALHGVRASQELVDARASLLVAREEERRALRRDLHDDLAPTLVGLGLTAAGIARMLRTLDAPPAAADRAADAAEALAEDLHSAIAQTRALAHGLRPAVLDNLGLVAAIRDRTRVPDEALELTVTADPDPLSLPAAVEVAALRIVQEAVANVRRHAGATRCDVRIETGVHDVHILVDDDGCGIPAGVVEGLGLGSMRARADELGGHAEILARPRGGTSVRARLPIGVS